MPDRVHGNGDKREHEGRPRSEDEAPTPTFREHDERSGEQRPEEAATRVRVREEAEQNAGGNPVPDRVVVEANRAFQCQQEQDEEKRLRARLDRHPAELEEPGREPRHEEDECGHEHIAREPPREEPEQ